MRNIRAYIDFLKEGIELPNNTGLKVSFDKNDMEFVRKSLKDGRPVWWNVSARVSGSYNKDSGPLDLIELYNEEWVSQFAEEPTNQRISSFFYQFMFSPGTNLTGIKIPEGLGPLFFDVGVNLTDADFSDSHVISSAFMECEMKGIDLSNAQISNVKILKCNMDGANLTQIKNEVQPRSDSKSSKFEKTSMKSVNLSNSNLHYSKIISCNLSGSNLSHGNFYGCNMKYSNLSNCDISHSKLNYIDFYRANLSGVKGLETCEISGEMDFRGSNLTGVSDEFFQMIFELHTKDKLKVWKSKENSWAKATPAEFFKGCKLPERVQRKVSRMSGMSAMFSS